MTIEGIAQQFWLTKLYKHNIYKLINTNDIYKLTNAIDVGNIDKLFQLSSSYLANQGFLEC